MKWANRRWVSLFGPSRGYNLIKEVEWKKTLRWLQSTALQWRLWIDCQLDSKKLVRESIVREKYSQTNIVASITSHPSPFPTKTEGQTSDISLALQPTIRKAIYSRQSKNSAPIVPDDFQHVLLIEGETKVNFLALATQVVRVMRWMHFLLADTSAILNFLRTIKSAARCRENISHVDIKKMFYESINKMKARLDTSRVHFLRALSSVKNLKCPVTFDSAFNLARCNVRKFRSISFPFLFAQQRPKLSFDRPRWIERRAETKNIHQSRHDPCLVLVLRVTRTCVRWTLFAASLYTFLWMKS